MPVARVRIGVRMGRRGRKREVRNDIFLSVEGDILRKRWKTGYILGEMLRIKGYSRVWIERLEIPMVIYVVYCVKGELKQ